MSSCTERPNNSHKIKYEELGYVKVIAKSLPDINNVIEISIDNNIFFIDNKSYGKSQLGSIKKDIDKFYPKPSIQLFIKKEYVKMEYDSVLYISKLFECGKTYYCYVTENSKQI
jgi:hypothetical protein